MGNLPVVHEVGTSFVSLGDAITGHPEKARERWDNYAKESVIGSYVAAVVEVSKGNDDKAEEYLKGMGRATGKAVLGGGLLRDVPVFHEIAVCGESLGDVIGGGDTKSAEKRWETYIESSVIGGGVAAIAAKIDGNDEEADKLAEGCLKAGARFGVSAVGIGATIATGGLAAPYGIAAAATTGVIVGGGVGAASTAAVQAIDKGKVDDPGAVVGSGLFGGVLGGITEGVSAKSVAAKAKAKTPSNSAVAKAKAKTPANSAVAKAKAKTPANSAAAKAKAKTPANSTSRPRARSQSFSSEAEYFPQHPTKMEGRNSFSFEGGKAQRNSQFEPVWSPKTPGNKLDVKAAAEAARREIQENLQLCTNKTRPGKIAVFQDEKGNAFGCSSVRGGKRAELKNTIGSKQTKALEAIPENARGVGHGNCAEQVGISNSRYFRQKSNGKLFEKEGKVMVQALGQAKGAKGVYTVPANPCGSCAAVLSEFGQSSSRVSQITTSCDLMARMIAAGLTVGCKDCQRCQEKENN